MLKAIQTLNAEIDQVSKKLQLNKRHLDDAKLSFMQAKQDLEPEIENMILVETQRGCPYRCGYCYYGKSRRRLRSVPPGRVIEAIAWARHQQLAEAYLLDPCLNSRRDLPDLLASLARVMAAIRSS